MEVELAFKAPVKISLGSTITIKYQSSPVMISA